MSGHLLLLIGAAATFVIAVATRRLERCLLSVPMLVTLLGATVALVDPSAAELVPGAVVTHVATATLALILFADAAEMRFRGGEAGVVRRVSFRLLAVGMPLCVVLGALVARAMFGDVGWLAALVLAVVLAPTDAALSQPVFDAEGLPAGVQKGIDTESGLNDGIGLPLLLVTLAGARVEAGSLAAGEWAAKIAAQLALGPIVGAVVGYGGARVLTLAKRHGTIAEGWRALTGVLLAAVAFSAAEIVHGNGFLAVFVGGLVFGQVAAEEIVKSPITLADEEGQLLIQVTFLLFGLTALAPALSRLTVPMVAYALLSLTVVRLAPVLVATVGLGLSWSERAFIGWFGPRGIASVVYLRLVQERSPFGEQTTFLVDVATITVGLSIVLHGASARPATTWLKRRVARRGGGGTRPDGQTT